MKRIWVPENSIAIVKKNARIERFLTAGKHWLSHGAAANIYDMSKDFSVHEHVDILLTHQEFLSYVHVIHVAEGCIAMIYWNNILTKVLNTGRHILWKEVKIYDIRIIDITSIQIEEPIPVSVLEKPILAPYVRIYKIEPNEKGVLFADNKFDRILDAGTYYWWRNHTSIVVNKIEMRQTILELSGQEILTKDKAQIRVNFSVQYQVVDVIQALVKNKDYEKQLHNMMQLALRSYIGQLTLDELMDNKQAVNDHVLTHTTSKALDIGIRVNDCGLKDIILPGEMKEILNQVLIAEKKAQANIIMRREETASTRSLLNTAKLMEDNAMLLRLKEMEYVEKIADKINSISISGNGQVIDQLKQLFVK